MCHVQSPAAPLSRGGQQGRSAALKGRSAIGGGRTTAQADTLAGRGHGRGRAVLQVWSESGAVP